MANTVQSVIVPWHDYQHAKLDFQINACNNNKLSCCLMTLTKLLRKKYATYEYHKLGYKTGSKCLAGHSQSCRSPGKIQKSLCVPVETTVLVMKLLIVWSCVVSVMIGSALTASITVRKCVTVFSQCFASTHVELRSLCP